MDQKKSLIIIFSALVLILLTVFFVKNGISKRQHKQRIEKINNELKTVEDLNDSFDRRVDSVDRIVEKRNDSIQVFLQKKERLKQPITKQEFDSIMKILQNESIDIDSLRSGQ